MKLDISTNYISLFQILKATNQILYPTRPTDFFSLKITTKSTIRGNHMFNSS